MSTDERPPPWHQRLRSTLRQAWEWEKRFLLHPLSTTQKELTDFIGETREGLELRRQVRSELEHPGPWTHRVWQERQSVLDSASGEYIDRLKAARQIGSRDWWLNETNPPDDRSPENS
jgi:hypothetical protein